MGLVPSPIVISDCIRVFSCQVRGPGGHSNGRLRFKRSRVEGELNSAPRLTVGARCNVPGPFLFSVEDQKGGGFQNSGQRVNFISYDLGNLFVIVCLD